MVARAIENARRVVQRLGHGIAHPEEELSRLQKLVVFAYDLVRHGWDQLSRDNAPQMAAALAYRTLFSLVPVLVIALVIARAFYGDEGIRTALEKLMEFTGVSQISQMGSVPGTPGESGDHQTQIAVANLLEQWVGRAVTQLTTINFGAITVVSIGVFIYAAIILLVQVEQSFNAVCQAPRGRSIMWRITTYWTLLTLGSVAIAASFALGRSWDGLLERLPPGLAWFGGTIGAFSKLGMSWLVLLFAYTRMPNARVRLRTAAAGAFVAAVLWEIGKGLFIWFVRETSAGQFAVYGSLALVPILLFWLYVTWHIVLFGLEVAWTLQTVGDARLRQRLKAQIQVVTIADPTAAVAIMQHLAAGFCRGESVNVSHISQVSRVPATLVRQLLAKMIGAGLAHRVESGSDNEAYSLARPPESIGVDEIVAVALELTPAATGCEGTAPGAAIGALRERIIVSLRGSTLSGAGGTPKAATRGVAKP